MAKIKKYRGGWWSSDANPTNVTSIKSGAAEPTSDVEPTKSVADPTSNVTSIQDWVRYLFGDKSHVKNNSVKGGRSKRKRKSRKSRKSKN